jgi:hypothetical protein
MSCAPASTRSSRLDPFGLADVRDANFAAPRSADRLATLMGSLIKKRRKRMRKKKHKKMLKRTRWQRRAGK